MSALPEFIPGSAGERFGSMLETRIVGGFLLRESRFGASLTMHEHCHPEPYFAYVVAGGMQERARFGECWYGRGSVHFHPSGDPHCSAVGGAGMTSLSIVPPRALAQRLNALRFVPDMLPGIAALAGRCHREFRARDDASDLALEGNALELVALLLR
jgi:hypothetical protein